MGKNEDVKKLLEIIKQGTDFVRHAAGQEEQRQEEPSDYGNDSYAGGDSPEIVQGDDAGQSTLPKLGQGMKWPNQMWYDPNAPRGSVWNPIQDGVGGGITRAGGFGLNIPSTMPKQSEWYNPNEPLGSARNPIVDGVSTIMVRNGVAGTPKPTPLSGYDLTAPRGSALNPMIEGAEEQQIRLSGEKTGGSGSIRLDGSSVIPKPTLLSGYDLTAPQGSALNPIIEGGETGGADYFTPDTSGAVTVDKNGKLRLRDDWTQRVALKIQRDQREREAETRHGNQGITVKNLPRSGGRVAAPDVFPASAPRRQTNLLTNEKAVESKGMSMIFPPPGTKIENDPFTGKSRTMVQDENGNWVSLDEWREKNGLYAGQTIQPFHYADGKTSIQYSFGNKEVWANQEALQGIGFLPDGQLICGANVTPEEKELALLVQNQVQEEDGTYYQEKINRLAKMITDSIPFNNHSEWQKHYDKIRGRDYYNIRDITEELNQIMKSSELDAQQYTDVPWVFNLYPTFFNNVKNGSAIDLKNNHSFSQAGLYIYDGEIVSLDALGNIAFGYYGKAFEFPNEVLRLGAGAAQIQAGTSKAEWFWNAFDDPRDTERINQGITIYDQFHK